MRSRLLARTLPRILGHRACALALSTPSLALALLACGGTVKAGGGSPQGDGGGLALGPGGGTGGPCPAQTQVDVPVPCDAGAGMRQDTSVGLGGLGDGATADDAAAAQPDAAVATVDGGAAAGDGGGTYGKEVCHAEWAQTGGMHVFPMRTGLDAKGNAYIGFEYVTYGDPPYPALNLGTPPIAYTLGFAIAKVDGACHLVWTREFGTSSEASQGVVFDAMAVDATGGVDALGTFRGPVDLGNGQVSTPGMSADGGFLLRLDTDGNVVFSRTFVPHAVDAMLTYDVALTPAGVATIAVNAGPDADFGGGADFAGILSGAATRFYVVQYDAQGGFLWQKPVSSLSSQVDEILELATSSSGALWANGWKSASGSYQQQVLGITSAGSLAWLHPVDGNGDRYLAAGENGAVVLEEPPSPGTPTLFAFGADGGAPWSQPVAPIGVDGGSFSTAVGGAIRLGASGDILMGGDVSGSIALPGGPVLTSAGGPDLAFETFDPTGHPRSLGVWGGPDDETFGGGGFDPDGNVVLGGVTTPAGTGADSPTERIFVVKLAP